MSLEIYNMTDYDLSLIKDILISDYDDFWTYNILEDELKNSSSEYFVAKLDNNILGFAGIWKSVDDVHITDIVVNTVFHIFREICDHGRKTVWKRRSGDGETSRRAPWTSCLR